MSRFNFTSFEKYLWIGSVRSILLSFILVKNTKYIYLITSLLGVTALLFVAKANYIKTNIDCGFFFVLCIWFFFF